MQDTEIKFVVVHWPNGEITIALDREYTLEEIEAV